MIDVARLPSVVALPLHEYYVEINPRFRLWSMVDTLESVLRTIVAVRLAELRDSDGRIPSALAEKIAPGLGRPTFAQYVAVVEAVSSHGELSGRSALVPELDDFCGALSGLRNLEGAAPGSPSRRNEHTSIIELRNRLAHGGIVVRALADTLLSTWADRFESAMERAAWLQEVRIVARAQAAYLVFQGPNASATAFAPSAAQLGALHGHLDEDGAVAALRNDTAVRLWPLSTYRSVGDEPDPHQQSYMRRDDHGLVYMVVGSSTTGQCDGPPEAIEAFDRLLRLDPQPCTTGPRIPGFEDVVRNESAGFVGRSDDVLRLTQAIAEGNGHVLWVCGPPGVGKTALLSRVACDMGARAADDPSSGDIVLFYRCSGGEDRHTAETFWQFVNERLALHLPRMAPNVAPDRAQTESMCAALNGRNVVLFVDEFEALAERNSKLAEVITTKLRADNLVCVCASDARCTAGFQCDRTRDVFDGGLGRMTPEDVRSMLCDGLTPAKRRGMIEADSDTDERVSNRDIETIVAKADGLPLFIRHVIRDINRHSRGWRDTLDDPTALPKSVVGYFDKHLADELGISARQRLLTAVCSFVAASDVPLREDVLLEALGAGRQIAKSEDNPATIRKAAGSVGSSLHMRRGSDGVMAYELHSSVLHSYFRSSDATKASVEIALDLFADIALGLHAAGEALAGHMKRHWLKHALAAGRALDAARILCGFGRILQWTARGDLHGLCGELESLAGDIRAREMGAAAYNDLELVRDSLLRSRAALQLGMESEEPGWLGGAIASQVLARMPRDAGPLVGGLRDEASRWNESTWLCPAEPYLQSSPKRQTDWVRALCDPARGLAFSGDGARIAVCYTAQDANYIGIHDRARDGMMLRTIAIGAGMGPIERVAFAGAADVLYGGGRDGGVYAVDLASNRIERVADPQSGSIERIAVDGAGTRLFVRTRAGIDRAYDISTRAVARPCDDGTAVRWPAFWMADPHGELMRADVRDAVDLARARDPEYAVSPDDLWCAVLVDCESSLKCYDLERPALPPQGRRP